MSSSANTQLVISKAHSLGFTHVGIASADADLSADYGRYQAFLRDGLHGDMAYLAQQPEARAGVSGEAILPGARSVICVAARYDRPDSEPQDPPMARHLARYARGRDYHNGIRKKLRRLAAYVRTLGAAGEVRARPLCDEEPILERAWASRAGLGFVGKNGLLIVPGVGSFVLLGEVVTSLALSADDAVGLPGASRCGSCTLCLDACPTQAFRAPYVLDARKCIAYLTIEKRGALEGMAELEGVGEHVFGCDVCQEVCPFNAGHRKEVPISNMFKPERWPGIDLLGLLELAEQEWLDLVLGSPLRRATWPGFIRNVALVLGNKGERTALPALGRVAAQHPAPEVRAAAAWAIQRIQGSGQGQ
jgi:epoxyqueuosine reductase